MTRFGLMDSHDPVDGGLFLVFCGVALCSSFPHHIAVNGSVSKIVSQRFSETYE